MGNYFGEKIRLARALKYMGNCHAAKLSALDWPYKAA